MNLGEVTTRMQFQLDNLGFHAEITTFNQLVQQLEIKNNRQIHLLPIRIPPGIHGAWISDGERPNEYVFYNAAMPVLLQLRIQLHELSHLICQHSTLRVTSKTLKTILQATQDGSIPASFVQPNFVCTSPMSSPNREIEAEIMTRLIQNRL